jgi:hypothetical protein
MAWIESHESLPTHPKTKRMCRLLKITPVVAIGHLHFLWWWAMNHAQDGLLDRYTPDDVADACLWEGDAGTFFNALVESKFIDRTSTGHEIHDWFVYAGKLIAIREKDAERKRISRGKTKKSPGHPPDIQRTSNGSLPESTRDLDLNLDLNQKNQEEEETALQAYTFSFKKLMYTGHIQDYVLKLMQRGLTDSFIREVFLEMGERGINADVNYMKKLAEDWIVKGIKTREEARVNREAQKVGGDIAEHRGRDKEFGSGKNQSSSSRSEGESKIYRGKWDDTIVPMPGLSG